MTEKRTWVGPSAPERLNILRNTRTIAIVGMSDKIRVLRTLWRRTCSRRHRTSCTL